MKIIDETLKNEIIETIRKRSNTYKDVEETINKFDQIKTHFITNQEDFDNENVKGFNPIAYRCKSCEEIYYSSCQYRLNKKDRYKTLLCPKCLRKKTCVDFYGTDNPMKNKKIASKVKNTWDNKSEEELQDIYRRSGNTRKNLQQEIKDEIERKKKEVFNNKYGVDNPMKCKEVQEKQHRSYAEKHDGYLFPMQNPEVVERVKEIWDNKSEEERNIIKEKQKVTFQNNYGYDWGVQVPEIIDKITESTFKSLGVKRPLQNKRIYHKFEQTMLEKIGVTTPLANKECRDKGKKTLLEATGYEYPTQYKINYYGITFESKAEFSVYLYCIIHNINVIRVPVSLNYLDMYGNVKHYMPDFWIQDIGLVEIKGDQFWSKDNTNKMIFPYNRLHHNSKPLTKEEKEYWNDLYYRKYQCGLQNGVVFWKEKDYKLYMNFIENLFGKQIYFKFKIDNPYNPSYFGLNGFHQTQKPYYKIPIEYSRPVNMVGISPYDMHKEDHYTVFVNGIYPVNLKKI